MNYIRKTGAVSLFAGSVLLVIYSVLAAVMMRGFNGTGDFCTVIRHDFWMISTVTVFAGLVLLMLGLAIVYSRIASQSGALGFAGIVVFEFAYLLQAAKVTWEIFIYPQLAYNDKASFLISDRIIWGSMSITVYLVLSSVTLLLGIIIFCVSMYRSGYYTKLSSVMLLIGAVMYGAGELVHMTVAITGIIIFAAGCFLCGITLLKNQQTDFVL
ncbi:MAG: hypothetical protein JXK07_15850 [Spirochaetes bacterium]|nr:hypothetical protein [Spirochaetota bacterium]MBN2770751.1 hypothetical protein [Spirochaetota bacterium]